ncbi:MAG: site-specific DNA-methyltransferase [Bacteroidales bacterium]|jgi:DNA modification methylase|nr:site-specific DNA-methyltransferase [Bacteroidales bacterium]
MKTEIVKLSQITTNAANPRQIKDEKFTKLVNSILVLPKMLELRPIVVDSALTALGGNMRYRGLLSIAEMSVTDIKTRLENNRDFTKKTPAEQAVLLEYWQKWLDKPTAIIIKASELSDAEQREFIIKDNASFGEWDFDMLANEWETEDLDDWGVDVWQKDDKTDEDNGFPSDSIRSGTLTERFVVPPFSILDSRKGYWQARKKIWRTKIGDMGESRNDALTQAPELKYKDLYQRTQQHRKSLGIGFGEYFEKHISDEVKEKENAKILSRGVSLLDPVMSEIICKWFGMENCKTFDCFAGDSVFGYVSSYLGNEFTGIELRQEQVQLNNERVAGMTAKYIHDDGQNVAVHIEADSQDLFFSCPPYYDLEKYSDLENDASNQDGYKDFLVILENAFKGAISCLKNERFAVIVVGDIRDKKTGFYYNFTDDVKRIFIENGVALYNELILIESGASTVLRAAKYMETRKIAKMHQNILVFYKGNPKNIKKKFKKIEYASEDLESFRVDSGNEPFED